MSRDTLYFVGLRAVQEPAIQQNHRKRILKFICCCVH